MVTSREHFALDWIKSGVLETLNQARQSLEAYAEALENESGAAPSSPGEAQRSLQSCLNSLHQVHGTLFMLELSGVTLLAEHLERVAESLLDGSLRDVVAPSQSLMQGMLELPGYLDELQVGLPDAVAPMLPLVNELRGHLGEAPLRDESAAASMSGMVPDAAVERFNAIDGTDKARRIRAVYQQVLLSLLKGDPLLKAMDTLRKVAQGLRRICAGTPFEGLWQAFGEFVASLDGDADRGNEAAGARALDGDLVKLLRRVDSEIRDLAQNGGDALRKPVPIALVRQLLEAAETRGYASQALTELKDAASRQNQSDAQSISARQALVSASVALREELALVKDRLDLFVRAESHDAAELSALVAPLKQIASALSLLGFESSRTMVVDQIERLNAMIESGVAGQAEILAAAGALVRVDENLASYAQSGKGEAQKITDSAQKAVALETRKGLDIVKQSIVDFVSSQWDVRHLHGVPERLDSLSGALRLIPLVRAAYLLDRCTRYVVVDLQQGHVPSWDELDLLADAISGIDYYLERLAEGNPAGAEDVLDLVERSLANLDAGESARVSPEAAAEVPLDLEPAEARESASAEEPADVVAEEPEYGGAEEVDVSAIRVDQAEPTLEVERDASFDLNNPIFDDLALGVPEQAAEVSPEVSPEGGVPEGPTEPAAETTPEIPELEASLADTFDSDEEIIEIFVEEVAEVLRAIDAQLAVWESDLNDEGVLAEIRRGFHTLKGSGRMVGANVLGELAWSVENMLNRVMDGTVAPTADFLVVVRAAREQIPALRGAYEARTAPDMLPVGHIMEQADVLASGGDLSEASGQVLNSAMAASGVDTPGVGAALDTVEASQALFIAEAEQHLSELEAAADEGRFVLCDETMRALHTLSGSAAMAGIDSIAELAAPAYELAQATPRSGSETRVDGDLGAFFQEVTGALAEMLRDLKGGVVPEDQFQLIAEADRLLMTATTELRAPDPLPGLGALDVVMGVPGFLQAWHEGAMDLGFAERLGAALDEIERVADAAGHEPVARLARALREAHERFESFALTALELGLLGRGHEQLLKYVDAIAADQALKPAPELLASIEALVPAEAEADEPPLVGDDVDHEIVEIFFEEAEELFETLERGIHDWSSDPGELLHLENLLRALHTLKGGARLAGMARLGERTHDFESFLINFQEAGAPADPALFDALHGWHDELTTLVSRTRAVLAGEEPPAGTDSGGSAEPADAEVPSLAEETEDTAAESATRRHDDRLDDRLDGRLDDRDETVADSGPEQAAEAPAPKELDAPRRSEKVALFPLSRSTPPVTGPPAEEPATGTHAVVSQSGASAPETPTVEQRPAQDMVRVGAGLLEELVNLAGESSIVRARIEQGMSDFTGSLDEMETTIDRLREQLRRLEIETETQVLFRQDRIEGPGYEDFDPLEMDRYSQLQQLSRALSESASDMLDLKDTLLFKAREAETLLLQQARLNTELQEGLMRSRMVPFNRLLPRLRRTVRQVSRELDKEVELHAFNVDGELDRNLLERMVPPLEHMLRNAVDHGIESPAERRARGKAAAGRVDLRLSREGGDVVIEISDDGAGIDVETVRAKAEERGLIAAGADLGDDEISQFVLAPGFSTAKSVTQISGRGVGMDVVHSEVKQLGGSINIFSRPGKGTRFVLRVPFTVSVNRALMVSVGDDLYAIPLNTIEGIVLLTPEQLERLYAPDGSSFEYAGVPYQVRYLGNFLGREYHAQSQRASVPVVLVRSGERAVAVHVDGVQGSREIVVKSLGPQFAGVGGISGATILGDGSVVVILDLLALIRSQAGDGLAVTRRPVGGAALTRSVMVVDDSVTVRKVTSRLLERQGMDVMVAKDGVEAVALLQERRPDILLLDIEMPRMDGFEVARQVRHDERLSDLPIIMISSRTGEKHQERALELGVNRFLGKPFQENELLACIDELAS